jgi:hypothetical protein
MPSPDEARRALSVVTNAAVGDAVKVFRSVSTVDQLLEALPGVVAYYSDGTAALAADHYDDLRDAAAAPGRFTAEPVVNLQEEKIRRGALWAVQPMQLAEPDEVLTLERLTQVAQSHTARPFRDTILTNRLRDPAAVGYQRHTSTDGCKFCRMLAGRGAVYVEATAHFASHPHCTCTASPVFHGNVGPEASVMQYVASKRRRTPSDQARLRAYLAAMPD